MTKLRFEELSFGEDKKGLKVSFLRNFYFYLDREKLLKISKYNVEKDGIAFENSSEISARRKFDFLLEEGFKRLKNRLNNKDTIYIHKNSGIPLIGTNYF